MFLRDGRTSENPEDTPEDMDVWNPPQKHQPTRHNWQWYLSDRQLIGPENWKQTAQNLHQWFIQVKRSIAILSKCLNSSMVLQAVLVL